MDYKRNAMNQGQRVRYLKAGAIVATLFFLCYLFFGSGSSIADESPIVPESPAVGITPDTSHVHEQEKPAAEKPSAPTAKPILSGDKDGDRKNDGQVATPGAETSRCTKSISADKPLIQYALMVDAGSTGSRIHVYKFNNCGSTPELEDEVFKMTEAKKGGSGLSSYDSDAEGAAKSLDVLLDVAVKSVPEAYQRCTPIAVKATAGLRKLGKEKSENILKAVRHRLETVYPFPVVSEANGGVEVMDGKDEGVYAWITANYLLGKIGGPDKTPTAAVLDLGGGSTQIVFEPTFPDSPHGGMPEKLAAGDHKYELEFGGRRFELYQHSFLGYGLMEARNNLHNVVLGNYLDEHPSATKDQLEEKTLVNPCIAPGLKKRVEVALPAERGEKLGFEKVNVTMSGPAESAPALCRAIAEQTLEKDAECALAPCSFRGIHQPSLSKVFAREDIYLFSYFYDRVKPLGMPSSFSLAELKHLTERVCRGSDGWEVFKAVKGAVAELEDRPEWCLDLNFMLALLNTGYEMGIEREVKVAKKIKGNELGWCLGASLPLLEKGSGWQCRIKEVPS